jgi:transglutaminase/protease-like cytokinesis protein 3
VKGARPKGAFLKSLKKPLLFLLVTLFIFTFVPVTALADFSTYKIDISTVDQGIVMVQTPDTSSQNKLKKVLVQSGNNKQIFTLPAPFLTGSIPLTFGNGNYSVTLFEQVQNNEFRRMQTVEVQLNLSDPSVVYLQSIQPIMWDKEMEAIKKAEQLTASAYTADEKIGQVYNYLVQLFEYDHEKAAGQMSADYTPDVEAAFQSDSGICYDASALFAAMLRSSGVPVKLVKGYAPDIKEYHAWNEVYIEGKGWITVDVTTDAQYRHAGYHFSMFKDAKLYKKSAEF